MAKLPLVHIATLIPSAITTINQNMDDISAAIENTVSRNGLVPNDMDADLDMNHNDILSAGEITTDLLTVGGMLFVPDAVTVVDGTRVLNALKLVDGAGSGLDADLLDGLNSTDFQPIDADLTSWGAVVRASGFDAFVASPTSANLRTLLTDEVGTGAAYFVGGALGTPASGTATNLTGLPVSSGISGLAAGIATFLATPSSANLAAALTDEVGTGVAYFVNGALGTPASVTLTNGTGLPVSSGISGLGANVAAWLATPSSANLRAALTDETGTGIAYFVGGALGTPSSATLTSATGLPVSTGISGLGAGIATFLATPSSANLAAALTDETGTAGTLPFASETTFTPVLAGTTVAGAGTYTTQGGFYTKIGNRVWGEIDLNWSAHTGTGNMIITGLPFTSGAAGSVCNVYCESITYAATIQAVIGGATSQIVLRNNASGAGATALPMDTAGRFVISFCYSTT